MAMLGPVYAGKLKSCEFSICPLPCSFSMPQQLCMLEKIYSELGKIVISKLGVSHAGMLIETIVIFVIL